MSYAQENDSNGPDNIGLTTREKIQYSLVGIVLLGGAVILARNLIKTGISRSEQRLTMEEGSAPALAKQIKMAFDNDGWWGTDKDALRSAVIAVPHKTAFKDVINSYQRLYGRSMMADMQAELKTTEYNEMLAIVSAKPEGGASSSPSSTPPFQSWAKRLKAAFDIKYGPFPGTDEEAIKAVFIEVPTQSAFQQLSIVYQNMFGSDLVKDLREELEFWEYAPMMQLIASKPRT